VIRQINDKTVGETPSEGFHRQVSEKLVMNEKTDLFCNDVLKQVKTIEYLVDRKKD
jgi:hypothetical protein